MFDKIYLIGNGRVADDCLRIMAKRHIPVEWIEVFAEKFVFTEKLCERLSIPFNRINKTEIKDFFLDIIDNTLIISAHNSYIFPADVCKKDNLTIINMHIAFLPQYRGMNPSTWAIFNQEDYSGVTWHEVNEKIDNGGIIVQRKIRIESDDTAMKLMMNCFKQGIELFEENLDSFLNKSYHTFIPDNRDTHLYFAKDLPNDGFLDESWDIDKIYAFLRSMDYTGSNIMRLPRVRHNGRILEITRYQRETADCNEKASVQWSDDSLLITDGNNSMRCKLREIIDA